MTPDLLALVLAPDGQWTTAAATHFTRDREPVWDLACWYVFSDRQAELHPGLAALLHGYAEQRPDVDIVHGDEVIAAAPGQPLQHLCKPAFDATQLVAQDYIGVPIAVRGRVMAALGGLDASAGSAQVYDLVLRATAAGFAVGRIEQVLAVNPAGITRATTPDRLAVLRRGLARSHPDHEVGPGLAACTVELRRRFDDPPPVSLVILPRRGAARLAPGLLDSLARTDWPMDRLHVVIGEDATAGPEPSRPFGMRRVATQGLSEAASVNRLWRASEAEHLVFLDAGLLVSEPGWLRALMTFAADPGIGGVGARLLSPDGAVRHAGMACGTPGSPGFAGLPKAAAPDQNWAVVQREGSVVSGEAFATRRSLLHYVNGLDERFGFACGQADLCLRLRLLGFRMVYTPHAELTQRRGASDGDPGPEPDETALFLQRWQGFLADDPAHHPRLSRNASVVAPTPSDQDWWRQRPNRRLNSPLPDADEAGGGAGGGAGVQPE